MSQPSSEERNAEQKSSTPKPQRSPIERIVVWVVILGLAGLVGVQYMLKADYDKNREIIAAALSRSSGENPVSFESIRGQLTKEPEISDYNERFMSAKLYTFKWSGLKTYKIELIVSKETGNIIELKEVE